MGDRLYFGLGVRRMLRCFALCAALSFTFVSLGFAEGPVLAGDPQIATVRTFQGPVTPRIVRVVPAPDVTVAVLADTVTPQEVPLLRRAVAAFLTPALLAKRPVRVILTWQGSINVSPPLSTASELQAVLKRITNSPQDAPSAMRTVNRLAELAATLP